MKALKSLAVAALLVAASTINAHAIGERERGALIGAGALLLLPTMVQNMGNLFGGSSYSNGYNETRVIRHEPIREVYVEPVVHREVIYVDRPVKRHYKPWKRHHKSKAWKRHQRRHHDRDVIIIYK